MKTTGLRFFTAYGPWGRPDMAYFKFTRDILEGKPIDVYNHGQMERDFTYIDDIVEGVISALDKDYEYEIFVTDANNNSNIMKYLQEGKKPLAGARRAFGIGKAGAQRVARVIEEALKIKYGR